MIFACLVGAVYLCSNISLSGSKDADWRSKLGLKHVWRDVGDGFFRRPSCIFGFSVEI